MRDISDDELMAHVDRELDEARSAEIDQQLLTDAALRKRIKPYVITREHLPAAFEATMDDATRTRFVAAIDRALIAPSTTERTTKPIDVWQALKDTWSSFLAQWMPTPVRFAGALGLGVLVGWTLSHRLQQTPTSDQIALVNGALVATSTLRQALEAEASRDIVAKAGTTVTATFRTLSGSFCREFTSTKHQGLGCRTSDGNWEIRAYEKARKTGSSQVVPVGEKSVVEAAINETTDNVVLSKDAEARLISQSWRKN